jgi:hypothetical protein
MAANHIPDPEEYFAGLERLLKQPKSKKALRQAVVDAPFYEKKVTAVYGLGIVALLLVDESGKKIDRIALSETDFAEGTKEISPKQFEDIKIPADNKENYIAQAIRDNQPKITTDWYYLFTPELTGEEAKFNQTGGAIACSIVYPLKNVGKGGALIFSYFEPLENIEPAHHDFMKRYALLASKFLH